MKKLCRDCFHLYTYTAITSGIKRRVCALLSVGRSTLMLWRILTLRFLLKVYSTYSTPQPQNNTVQKAHQNTIANVLAVWKQNSYLSMQNLSECSMAGLFWRKFHKCKVSSAKALTRAPLKIKYILYVTIFTLPNSCQNILLNLKPFCQKIIILRNICLTQIPNSRWRRVCYIHMFLINVLTS